MEAIMFLSFPSVHMTADLPHPWECNISKTPGKIFFTFDRNVHLDVQILVMEGHCGGGYGWKHSKTLWQNVMFCQNTYPAIIQHHNSGEGCDHSSYLSGTELFKLIVGAHLEVGSSVMHGWNVSNFCCFLVRTPKCVSHVFKLFPFISSGVIHSYELMAGGVPAPSLYDNSPPCLSLCSCVSLDVYEWRSMQLEEALPVPAWFHRPALPVSTPADAASAGSTRQQAAHLPHISEARQPETRGAIRHRVDPNDTNTLIFYASRAPLIWRYLLFSTVRVRRFVSLGFQWAVLWYSLSSLSLFSVQINLHVHHTPDTSVVIQPLDQPDVKLPHKIGPRPIPSRHKPKGRCFQETTPKQAVSSDRCRGGRPAQCFEVSFSTDNAHLSYLAPVQQHAASCSDQSGGLLWQCGKLVGTKQVLSVPQTAEWVPYKSWCLFGLKSSALTPSYQFCRGLPLFVYSYLVFLRLFRHGIVLLRSPW